MEIIKHTRNQLVISQPMTPYSPLKIILITGSTILSLGLLLVVIYTLGVEKLTCQRKTETQQVSCELNQSTWMGLKQEPVTIIDEVTSVEWEVIEGDSETADTYNFILHTLSNQYYYLVNDNKSDFDRFDNFLFYSQEQKIQLRFDMRLSLLRLTYITFLLLLAEITVIFMQRMIVDLKEGNSQQRIFTFDTDVKVVTVQEITDKKINKTQNISLEKVSLLIIENVPDNCKNDWYDGLINYTFYIGLKCDYYNFKKTQLQKSNEISKENEYPLILSLISIIFLPLIVIIAMTFYLFLDLSQKETEEFIEIELLFSDRYSEVEKFAKIIASFLEIETHLIKANC